MRKLKILVAALTAAAVLSPAMIGHAATYTTIIGQCNQNSLESVQKQLEQLGLNNVNIGSNCNAGSNSNSGNNCNAGSNSNAGNNCNAGSNTNTGNNCNNANTKSTQQKVIQDAVKGATKDNTKSATKQSKIKKCKTKNCTTRKCTGKKCTTKSSGVKNGIVKKSTAKINGTKSCSAKEGTKGCTTKNCIAKSCNGKICIIKNCDKNTTTPTTKPSDNNSNGNASNENTKPSDTTTETNGDSTYEEQIVNLVNQERAKAGLSAVKLDKNLQAAAYIRAKECVTSFSHTRPNGSSFYSVLTENNIKYKGCGENIAWGQRNPEAVMTAWMNSSGHRANILNPSFTAIGVGYYQNGGTNYWSQLFTY